MAGDFNFNFTSLITIHCHSSSLHHLLYLLFIITILPFSTGEIKTVHISDDARPMIIFERFGFPSSGGQASVSANHVSWKSTNLDANLDPSSMGFFLADESKFPQILNEVDYKDNFCVLKSIHIEHMFNFSNPISDSAYAGSIAVNSRGGGGEYVLAFGNCQPEFEVSMTVRFEMYNLDGYGNKNFLPAGETLLPTIYFAFFVIYASFLAIWIWILICFKNHRSQIKVVDKIHILMAALLFFKAMKMICAAEDKIHVAGTGKPHGWDIAFYIFGFFKGVALFTVIVLIGTGWSVLKPYLQDREKNVLIFVIPLQILENVAAVIIGETGPAGKDWMTWNQAFLIIDVVCCAAVFFPIVWSIRALKEAVTAAAATSDGKKASRNLEKLTMFKQFYGVVVVYLWFTRIVVPVAWSVVGGGFEWGKAAAGECASFAFYGFVFYKFRPAEKNPYLTVGGGSDDDDRTLHLHGDQSFEDEL